MFWLVGRFLCRTAWAGVCPNQLVQAGNGNQLIPIHPVDAADVLIARAAEAPAEEEVVLSTVQAVPSIGGELVDVGGLDLAATAAVDADLAVAEVVGEDEEDVGFGGGGAVG